MAHTGRPPRTAIIAIVLVVVAIAVGAWWWFTQRAAVDEQVLSGTIEGTEYRVAPTLAGRIETVTAAEGDQVSAGDVLVRLDNDAFVLQLKQAQAAVRAAKAQVSQAQDDGTDAEVAAAKAQLDQARAGVDLAKVQVRYTVVKAPHDGVVVAVSSNAGENASPGKTVLTLLDQTAPYARFYVPETRIGDIALGDTVRIVTSDGLMHDAKVDFIASQAEFTPTNVETDEQRAKLVYEVRASIDDPDAALKPGMPVDVSF